jgi:hypothetical protein
MEKLVHGTLKSTSSTAQRTPEMAELHNETKPQAPKQHLPKTYSPRSDLPGSESPDSQQGKTRTAHLGNPEVHTL